MINDGFLIMFKLFPLVNSRSFSNSNTNKHIHFLKFSILPVCHRNLIQANHQNQRSSSFLKNLKIKGLSMVHFHDLDLLNTYHSATLEIFTLLLSNRARKDSTCNLIGICFETIEQFLYSMLRVTRSVLML